MMIVNMIRMMIINEQPTATSHCRQSLVCPPMVPDLSVKVSHAVQRGHLEREELTISLVRSSSSEEIMSFLMRFLDGMTYDVTCRRD